MHTLHEDIDWVYNPQPVFEMANMQPADTGLKATIHIMHRGGAKHGARVKVSNVIGRFAHDDNFTITVDQPPRVTGTCTLKGSQLQDIIDWVVLNHNHLWLVWERGDSMRPSEVEAGFERI